MTSQYLITDQSAVVNPETYSGNIGRQLRDGNNLLVLIADNSDSALRTTRDYFVSARFNIISVSSPQAAKLIIEFKISALDAIVLDGRLSYDEDEKDRSGYELAQETLAQIENPPPIFLYSRWDDRYLFDLDWTKITFVSKDEPRSRTVLVEKVLEQINLRPSNNPRPANFTPPVIVLDSQSGSAANRLQAELTKYGIHARTCASLPALIEVSPYLPSAMFIIDLEACGRDEGLQAIRDLKESQDALGAPSYIAALAGNEELRDTAAQTGSDLFLVKDSPETDAMEIRIRMAQHKMELEQVAVAKQLTVRWYPELVKQLRNIKESPASGMTAPLETVERALDWSFLLPEEQLVLTALYTQMRAVGGGQIDAGTIDLCLEGASMLTQNRAQGADVHEWVERATQHSPDFTLGWFKEEFLPEVYGDDEEEGDD